ncbi:hypothetical protein QUF64_12780 [Anaerolineales bacterium HSG6]|nr:hypothetical protein [Anaerolineales bacterium HSG6]MDM8530826.1 hypothetical protein [Anaerolineales bacterium HSG25]
MARKPYTPTAPYAELKRVEGLIDQAEDVAALRKIVATDGPKIGYKAFCYILGGKMTPEAMKADEACVAAAMLENQGNNDDALEIYKKIIAVHKEHPIAKGKVG